MKNKFIKRQKNKFLHLFILGIFFQFASFASAQNQNISGKIVDDNGEPVIGATIIVKGTTNGTSSKADGSFVISADPNASIQVSFIGHESKIVNPSGKTNIIITLEESLKTLDDVVVVGYGTQKKVNLTGSVAAISSKDISGIPVANTATLLQGRLPGVVLTSNGAQAGNDTPEIRIRGIGTFGENNPMVLIDGVEGSISQISNIPANDIDNISVLKDAASASIYGVRAANGVILIATKRGGLSRPVVNYSGSYTVQSTTCLPDYVDSYNWALMYNESKGAEIYTSDMLQKFKDGSDPDHFANTDWTKEIFRTAGMQKHHLSVAGGTESVHYMLSAFYSDQDGIMINTGDKQYGFRSNVDAKFNRFSFGLNLSGNRDDIQAPVTDVGGGDGSIMRYLSWYTRPTVPAYYENGHYGYVDGSSISHVSFKNPIADATSGYKENQKYRFDGKTFVGLDIMDGLKFQISLAYSLYLNKVKTFTANGQDKYDADGNVIYKDESLNSLTDYYWMNGMWTNENILTYNKKIGDHTLGIIAGHSAIGYKYSTTSASISNFATNTLYELDAGTENPTVEGKSEEYTLQSFFGRVNYNYLDRYLLEANIRRDGSSRMPKNHRYGTFPSVTGAWIVSNESFFREFSDNLLKFRASWGMLGNQEIGNYAYSPTMAANYNYYFGDTKYIGMAENSVANDNIKWETTRVTDFGVDASFWNGRISTTFDWFNKETSDILMQITMPSIYLGSLSAPYQNIGAVRNRGWELSANYNDRKGDWTWTGGFSLSSVKNSILEMGDLEETYGTNTINKVGEAINSFYGLKALGIYSSEDDLNRTNSTGVVITQNGAAPQLGDIMYQDLDDDGNINSSDRQIIGNPFPELSYSFNAGLSWKNFDLSLFFQGVSGLYRYSWESTLMMGNMTSRWLDRWSESNPDGSMPSLVGDFNGEYSSFWLEKADYLRLKNAEFGYTFHQEALKKAGISGLRVYVAGTNLLTFTSLKNYDPEKSNTDQRNDVHPNTRTCSFGVNIQF